MALCRASLSTCMPNSDASRPLVAADCGKMPIREHAAQVGPILCAAFRAGLAASARSTAAVQRIYEIKQRQESAPLAICVADVHDVSAYGDVGHLPAGLLSRLLPGPVTVVLPRRADAALSPELNPGTSTIGVPASAATNELYGTKQALAGLYIVSQNVRDWLLPLLSERIDVFLTVT